MDTPVVVDFPLKSEWIAPNTPGTKVPSRGTDALGERYAYDFVGIDPKSRKKRFYIIEASDGYAVYTHAQTGSIIVAPGDKILPGQRLAKVGHSGNSTAPHLHFQLMDHLDPWKAQGVLCCFREYEAFDQGAWHPVQNGIPKATDRIRNL